MLEQGSASNYQLKSVANELVKGVAEGLCQSTGTMLEAVGRNIGGFLEIMMEPVYDPCIAAISPDQAHEKKKRKNKGQSTDQSLGQRM